MLRALSIDQIAEITRGELIQNEHTQKISQIAIDSRQVSNPEKTLFISLVGAKAKGQDFIPALIDLGVRNFIVHRRNSLKSELLAKANFVLVDDTRKALQEIARYQRSYFEKPVVSITGSNGKTIVKEWLGQVLSQAYQVAKSPKSYNSQVGVPLSVFGIDAGHQVAILEAGISKTGEMGALERIIQPNLGIFTNIGSAHKEGFSSQESKILEKLSLFKGSDFLVYCKDQELPASIIEQEFSADKLIAWSDKAGADYTRSIKIQDVGAKIIFIKSDLSTMTFHVPFSDPASLENITHVLVGAMTLGLKPELIQQGLNHLKPVDMRLTLKPGVNDSLLIDDTYNNDLAGLKVALDFLNLQRPKKRKILILSDLLQQGTAAQLYSEVAEMVKSHHLDQIIGVGQHIFQLESFFPKQFIGYSDTEKLLEELNPEEFSNDLILITGARPFGFERVVNKLQQRIHGTTLEINLNALTHNYNFYKSRLKPETKVMVMVKAFAYGGGSVEIANHIQTMGADYLAVAFTDEGVTLRKHGISLPIMVLNPMEESIDLCHQYELEPVVYSPAFFKMVSNYCQAHDSELSIHLDMDTGMHRLGFEEKHLEELGLLLEAETRLRIASVYTHLVGADEEIHKDYSLRQLELFKKMKGKLEHFLPSSTLFHALNSAGIVAFPDFQMDMVRLGIGLYGVEVTGKHASSLRSISTLKTTISQIKTLEPGETVGYSRKGSLPEGGKIATLSLGYADGYDRRFSNGKGYVIIQGKKAPIIGNICMDMCMVDVTDIEDVKAGNEAIIYGEGISLKELAERIETIPYELLTNISARVKRIYYLD